MPLLLKSIQKVTCLFSKRTWLALAAFAATAVVVGIPNLAHAGIGTWLTDQAYGAIADVVFWISSLLVGLAGIIVAIEAWFLQIILNLNLNIVNSTPVKLGFPIVLAISNMVFVAGMIVIAIATILRREHYGVKKILWKLVVMAVMVNFGLVICGALISISDNMTLYFINSINPFGTGSGSNSIGNFVTSLAGAFNPHDSFIHSTDVMTDPSGSSIAIQGAIAGQNIGKFLLPFSGLLATIGSLFIIILTLGTLIVMLFIRYIKLGMLLITLPIAWASFVFPAYEEHYKKWWTSFTKNAIFPPVTIFFLWLALKISEVMNSKGGEFNFTRYQSNVGNDAWATLANFFTNLFSPTIEQLLRIFILWGIMMGGLVAAQELGIKFADAGVKAAEGAGGWAKGKAGYYAKRGGRNVYQKLGGRRREEQMKSYAGKSAVGRFFAPVVTNLGRGIQGFSQKGGSELVEKEKKDLGHDMPATDSGKAAMLQTGLRFPQQLAVLSSMTDLSKVKEIDGVSMAEWLSKNHQAIEDYAQHGLEAKIKESGADHGVLAALGPDSKSADEIDEKELERSVGAAMKNGDPKQLAGMLRDGAFGLSDKKLELLRAALVKNIGEVFTPDQFSDFVSGLKKDQKENLQQTMEELFNYPDGDKSRTKLSPEAAKAEAEKHLGKDNLELIRDNGAMQNRGFYSDRLWQEPRKEPVNKQPIGTSEAEIARKEAEKKKVQEEEAAHHKTGGGEHEAEHPARAAAPHPPTGGGGGHDDHGGGGGGHDDHGGHGAGGGGGHH